MPDEMKNGLIGIFVIAGLAILVFIILFLHPQTGDEGQTLYVRFPDIDKIQIGSRVTFAGKAVGEVADIRDLPAPRDEAFHDNAIYPYQLVLKLDSHVKIFSSDEFIIHTSGLLGERSVAIIPRHPVEGVTPVILTDKDIIFADSTPTLEETLTSINGVALKAGDVMDNVIEQLNDLKSKHLWDRLEKIAANVMDITEELNIEGDWRTLVTNLTTASGKVNEVLDRADAFFVDATNFTTRLHSGKGTMARLVNNDDLYMRVTAVMSKADTIMDDINHYGILFHNDKGWQRLRARRMNLLQQLQTPQEFRNFFNDEVNLISTSLERVSMVLDETFCNCAPEELLDDAGFECLFADLLRRITGLEENIKMYNEQLVTEHEKLRCCK